MTLALSGAVVKKKVVPAEFSHLVRVGYDWTVTGILVDRPDPYAVM